MAKKIKCDLCGDVEPQLWKWLLQSLGGIVAVMFGVWLVISAMILMNDLWFTDRTINVSIPCGTQSYYDDTQGHGAVTMSVYCSHPIKVRDILNGQ